MRLGESEVYLTVLASTLGETVDIGDLDDPRVRESLVPLRKQGIARTRISRLATEELAAAVTVPAMAGTTIADYQAVVVCTDTLGAATPTEWVLRYRATVGLPAARILFVSGSGCANFIAGLDVARGLLAMGVAESVLLVTADKVPSGSRHPPLSMTVFSDGAVSCLVSRDRRAAHFRLTGVAVQLWPEPGPGQTPLAHARTVVAATRVAVGRIVPGSAIDVDRVVTPNFGSATRELLAMAVPVPIERLHAGLVADVGHCFAADIPLNLDHLSGTGTLSEGDAVLAIASSSNTLAALLLMYESGP